MCIAADMLRTYGRITMSVIFVLIVLNCTLGFKLKWDSVFRNPIFCIENIIYRPVEESKGYLRT